MALDYRRNDNDHLVEAAFHLQEAIGQALRVKTLHMKPQARGAAERAIRSIEDAVEATGDAINALGGPLVFLPPEER